MRNFILPIIVVAAAGFASASLAAAAAPTTTTGTIKSLDAKACTVTLDSDAVYKFKAKCDFASLKVGEKVTLTYITKTTLDASKIVAAV